MIGGHIDFVNEEAYDDEMIDFLDDIADETAERTEGGKMMGS